MPLFCAICGGPLRQPTSSGGLPWAPELRWQSHIMLLYDPAQEFETLEVHYRAGKRKDIPRLDFRREGPDQDIQKVRAICAEDHHHNNEFLLLERDRNGGVVVDDHRDGTAGPDLGTRTRVQANVHSGRNRPGDSSPSMPYYIAAHEACVDIAERVIKAARWRGGVRVRSLRTLWKVLRMRFDAHDNEIMAGEFIEYILMHQLYYMPYEFVELDSFLPRGGFQHWCMADPAYAPGLTDMLVENLKVSTPEPMTPEIKGFQERFLALPQELQDHITSFLNTKTALPRHSTRLLLQKEWKRMLVYGRQLSFLWDLDIATIESADPTMTLDWEQLVRSLSQVAVRHFLSKIPTSTAMDVICYDQLRVPNGLRNRRRIWQLVEGMFVGDVLPVARGGRPQPTMPRYWDEDGEPVYPILRVPSIVND